LKNEDEVEKTLTKEEIKLKKKKEKEKKFLKDAWNILINGNNEEDDKIDSNNLLIFLCSLLGLYKGEEVESKLEKTNNFSNTNTQPTNLIDTQVNTNINNTETNVSPIKKK